MKNICEGNNFLVSYILNSGNVTKNELLQRILSEISSYLSLSATIPFNFRNSHYKKHLSLREKFPNTEFFLVRIYLNGEKNLFSLKPVTSAEVLKTIYTLKNNKESFSYTIQVKILKTFSRSLLPYLTGVINHSITTASFPDELKLAEVISAFKKDNPLD